MIDEVTAWTTGVVGVTIPETTLETIPETTLPGIPVITTTAGEITVTIPGTTTGAWEEEEAGGGLITTPTITEEVEAVIEPQPTSPLLTLACFLPGHRIW